MKVDILQVAYDSGHRAIRMGGGPLRLLHAGLADHLADPERQVRVIPLETGQGFTAEVAATFELAGKVGRGAIVAREEGRFPLLLAGNCAMSIGMVAALDQPDVYWFDAHGDLNTPETTTSGFLDGMALSILLGRCWQGMATGIGLTPLPEDRICLLGARDLDAAEADFLADSRLRRVGPGELYRLDHAPDEAPGETLGEATVAGTHEGDGARPGDGRVAYLHIDLDALDPSVGRANPFASPGGFGVDEVVEVVDRVAERARLAGAALTAYDPEADVDGAIGRAAFRIAKHIVDRAEAGRTGADAGT